MKNDHYILQYIKRTVNGRKQRVGIVVAVKDDDGQIQYGWGLARVKPSKQKPQMGIDKFNVNRGMDIAFGRIEAKIPVQDAPVTVASMIRKTFEARAKKYFRV